MTPKNSFLKPGKLPPELMKRLLNHFKHPPNDANVKITPTFGQDTGIFQLDRLYVVVKTNPVTFATDDIGYYAVILNANDIALSGAIPKWFSTTILLPEKNSDEKLCEDIFQSIAEECKKLEIAVVAGHTEVTYGIDHPIVVGTMMGKIPIDRNIISTFGGKPNDDLLLINPIGIEGTSIIARERSEYLLKNQISAEQINEGKKFLYNPGISIIDEAKLLTENFKVHAIHGPTEGGISMGLVELARNSQCGLEIKKKEILIDPLTLKLSELFQINPLGLISSGCLIVAVNPEETVQIMEFFQQRKIPISLIGKLIEKETEYIMIEENGTKRKLKYSHIDEITKIFMDSK
ncbi:MAG: AIR synthase related protein [Promethearchaeota archaeon]